MQDIEVRIHWLSITVYTDIDQIKEFWVEHINPYLGLLDEVGHGAAGFRHMMKGLAGSKLYHAPINNSSGKDFVHLVFPGQACDALDTDTIREIVYRINLAYQTNATRLDVAFDYVPFTPHDFFKALCDGDFRSLAKRESVRFDSSPRQPQKTGEKIGCSTTYLGSRSSTRSLRVYDQRGYTRLEVEYHRERANEIVKQVFPNFVEKWPDLMVSHLLDFVDLREDGEGQRLNFWETFVQGMKRAGLKISDAREADLNKTLSWVGRQVSPGLSVIVDACGEEKLDEIINIGRQKRGRRYDSIVDNIDLDRGEVNAENQ